MFLNINIRNITYVIKYNIIYYVFYNAINTTTKNNR